MALPWSAGVALLEVSAGVLVTAAKPAEESESHDRFMSFSLSLIVSGYRVELVL